MEVIFKAKDGTMFNNAEECVQYEATLDYRAKDWEAWGWDGKPTKKTLHAVVVRLNNEDAAEQFLAAAELEDDSSVEGIEPEDEGWFFYDEGGERYILINESIINIFKNIFAS